MTQQATSTTIGAQTAAATPLPSLIVANFACMYRMSHYHLSNTIFLPSRISHLLSNHLIANQTLCCFEQTKPCIRT
ncbi:hypothetical protein BU25DRAFT_81804 [Macroventuria anomochaeta]|uniref:Uncharacterized protein n=1 Tax=Macroventuria anomochaeta TaxID=301207 RepID=A0ACB6SHC6_9PLEO|nr:uncharacterized protein BU25DRAFT_81804 [Macroventuria anomochaeta]KAF2632753.1 hypothetical protein BU25DRAFT_81804 [Macroventuria anomochaeta]